MKAKIINKKLEGFTGDAWLVAFPRKVSVEETLKTKYFVISGTFAMYSGWEVLVFPADKNGKVLDMAWLAW